ncbi:MAG: gfo/Idh/MocA family oxidoreductase [Acidobacteria bacterium]|nr:gfo/Idh/MocA family oxidoreductase [Acidobacteriota bacterium]
MASATRRDLFKTAAGAACLLGSSRAWAGANDRIRVGLIGVGARGDNFVDVVPDVAGMELAALCDPDENRLAEGAAKVAAATGKRPKTHADLRRVLDDSSIDAVVIANCNHWHALSAIWACQAGKHPYVEKPISHNIVEGQKVVRAVRKAGLVSSGGTQRRSHPNFREAIRLLHDGVIGDLYMASWVFPNPRESIGFKKPEAPPAWLNWNLWRGPAPEQPYHQNLVHYNWHWFWDFGNGEMGNNGSHLVDICNWGLRKDPALPTRIHAIGGRWGYQDQAQTPNTVTATWEHADGTIVEGKLVNLYTNEQRTWRFYGTKGHMEIGINGLFHVYMGRNSKPEPDLKAPIPPTESFRPIDKLQLENWAAAMRAKDPKSLNAEIEDIASSNAFCHLANISYRLRREVRFDPKTMRFDGDEQADALLQREYRGEFRVPDKV